VPACLSLKAQSDQTRSMVNQNRAVLVRTKRHPEQDRLHFSPSMGSSATCPCAWESTLFPAFKNSNGSFLMTLSDMSLVTSEVKVDETDIVNVRIGQDADVTIDAVPGENFQG